MSVSSGRNHDNGTNGVREGYRRHSHVRLVSVLCGRTPDGRVEEEGVHCLQSGTVYIRTPPETGTLQETGSLRL